MSPPIGSARAGLVSQVGDAIPDSENLGSQYVASSFSLNDGDTISSAWDDQAGSFDASVVGDPVYRESAINGQPAVDVDAPDDYFDTGFVQDTNNPVSIYLVHKIPQTSSDLTVWGAINTNQTSTNRFDINTFSSDNEYQVGYGDNADQFGSISTNYEIWEFITDGGGSGEFFVNGSSIGTLSYSGQGSQNLNSFIGARNFDGSADQYHGGQIAEILRYTTNHDSTTRSEVESDLNDKYDIF